MAPPLNMTQCHINHQTNYISNKLIRCYLSEIDQITAFVAIFGQKTGNKLQYVVNNGGQNNVIIAKKSNFIHCFKIAHKTAFFTTRIMAPYFYT